jgi:hypothetical protein
MYYTLALSSMNAVPALADSTSRYTVDWSQQIGSVTTDVAGSIEIDPQGNIIIGGWTAGDFDGNQSFGVHDFLLAKFTPDGIKLWSRQFGTPTADFSNDIAVDYAGNTFITGSTQGVFEGTYFGGVSDMYLAKYDPAGNRMWVRQFGSPDRDQSHALAVDAAGNAYVTGRVEASLDGNTAYGHQDMFLVKYDPMGNKIWSIQAGTSSIDTAESIAIDRNGYIYIAGESFNPLNEQPIDGAEKYVFIAKYDQDGNRIWINQIGSSGNIDARRIAIDNSNHLYLSGDYGGEIEGVVSNGSSDLFLAKFEPDGSRQWLQQFGSDKQQYTYGLTTDASGKVFMSYNEDSKDAFLVAVSSEGFILSTTLLDSTSVERASDITTDIPGVIYIAGPANSGLNGNIHLGNADAYILRLVVPEPATIFVIGIGMFGVLRRQTRSIT